MDLEGGFSVNPTNGEVQYISGLSSGRAILPYLCKKFPVQNISSCKRNKGNIVQTCNKGQRLLECYGVHENLKGRTMAEGLSVK